MPDWRELKVEGLGPVERVVAVFQIGPPLECLPFSSFKVKVIERANGSFLAVLNVATRDLNGHLNNETGLGETVGEALEDALRRFARVFVERQTLSDSDFIWSDPTEF